MTANPIVGAEPPNGAKSAREDSVSVKSFGRGNVIGHLGHPLGTVVRITGLVIDGNATRRRVDAGRTLLEVQTVNDVRLDRPFRFAFPRGTEISKPKAGDRFDYYAHEQGRFSGIVSVPDELDIEQPIVANDGFHYRPELMIHRSNAVTTHPSPRRKAEQ
ncbi:hypothetical protein LOC71_04945 [Rhodopirellula sp. JC740]|uniref:Uncharacterized protein n=1 Tax=Rhodopirellula halodulae TaxID=2894198 RepID=A0ABS8NDI4_9BACT|nr:hypothetical protein [Rhodopirellula sp. JC740]MCC9641611.1 hypothetical protein [Rhodopirellula sp. JC740]